MENRPAVNKSRLLGAASMVLGLVPMIGRAFFGLEWTPEQVEIYSVAVGTVVAAVALLFGVQVEKVVTPVAAPRNDDLVPLVPVAPDGPEI